MTPQGNGVAIKTVNGESSLHVFGNNVRVEYRNPAMGVDDYAPVKPGSLPAGFT